MCSKEGNINFDREAGGNITCNDVCIFFFLLYLFFLRLFYKDNMPKVRSFFVYLSMESTDTDYDQINGESLSLSENCCNWFDELRNLMMLRKKVCPSIFRKGRN